MQLVDPHLTTPSAYVPDMLGHDTRQHKFRVLVDEVATTRGLVLQMSMRAMGFHAATDDEQRRKLAVEFDGMRSHFRRNVDLVFGTARVADQDPDHVARLRSSAARDPGRALLMRQVAAAADSLGSKMAAQKHIGFDEARSFFARNWPVARDQMTQVIWDVWADMDADREKDLTVANAAATAMDTRLTRLENIGKHVRLVSLNASVEAARAGEVGKGLMVIAQEFKALAEEIQSLAKDARKDMTAT